ncbi:MAG: DUF5916 domain-containing protein [Chitinophagaceae bacterium]
MRKTCCFVLLLATITGNAQLPALKKLPATRATAPVKLDGIPDEAVWKSGEAINGMVEMRPTFNRPEDAETSSSYYLLYDDENVYFAGIIRERSKDSVTTQLAGRDEIGINDFAGIIFDTYQDKINGLGFYVSPLNEQFDVKYSIGNEDISWNAVYFTQTQITDKGWTFEMQIPYHALRFSRAKMQDWNINILRRRARTGQQYSWSPVDPTRFGFVNQSGSWTGIRDIKPPLRLSFSPYFSTYANRRPGEADKWETSVNGGMDVKYGITDGFTMDMTLIPDFGQVQSDNQVLNLSPFEVRFNENRQFFNEGTELFSKANLFYSRRIGGTPINYSRAYDIPGGHTVIENPGQTKLINATKISGRTKKKLGIGFFNAITDAQYATVETNLKEKYKIETSPLTNYNVLVLDQSLPNNSRVTLVNTNVLRNGSAYDANVSAIDWDLYDKNVNWNVWGQVNHSRLTGYEAPGKTWAGSSYRLFLGKFKGNFNFDVHRLFADDKYNQSDMGYFRNNNYVGHGFYAGYKLVKPKSFYNNIYFNMNGEYTQLYKPRRYQDFKLSTNVNSQLKSLWQVWVNFSLDPSRNDFYEARIPGMVVKQPGSFMKGAGVGSNSAKKYSFTFETYSRTSKRYNTSNLEATLSNTFRFNEKLSLTLSHYGEFHNRNFGFATLNQSGDSAFMSLRKIRTVENILNIKYNFSRKTWLTMRLRHYWSKVHYYDFFAVKEDGRVVPVNAVYRDPDINANLLNMDMNFTWQFAPGSFINATWKTASETYDQLVMDRYYRNLKTAVQSPSFNSLSLKVIYFFDYAGYRSKRKN